MLFSSIVAEKQQSWVKESCLTSKRNVSHHRKGKKLESAAGESAESRDTDRPSETRKQPPRASSASSSTRVCETAEPSTSASSEKLLEHAEVEFDAEEELIGFRFVDCELLIKFVQGLLCPECQRPLGAGRLSSVTEDRTHLASPPWARLHAAGVFLD